ncbi:MAG TPA: response regulator [Spirochaetia bacterium]|nr:response regulator [Spirochaetia bacterium]
MNEIARILLVDDDPRDVELTIEALSENRLANEVVVVNDGEEALEYLFRNGRHADRAPGNPAVTFLDLKLPKISGIEVLRRIRGDGALRTLPVVILTSSREERDLVEGYRTGANAYVVKPVEFTAFINAVRELGLFWAIMNEPPPYNRA